MAAQRMAAAPRTSTVAAVLLSVVALVESLARHAGTDVTMPFALLLALVALATTAPLALNRPTTAASVVVASALLSLAVFHELTMAGLTAALIAAYRLGRGGSRPLGAILGVPFLLVALADDPGVRVRAVLLAALVPALALAGCAYRARQDALANRAARQAIAGSLLEHTARGERARIARELHDVVAHHISMITVQAEAARLTTPGMPDTGVQRLSAIGDTARAALTEMRRLLGVLREDAHTDTPVRQPQPGLHQLNELIDEARAHSRAGTRLILSGHPVELDPGVELTAYRIVQECLTNSRRHAPGAAVDVELHYGGEVLRLLIRDNGPGPTGAEPVLGHGLQGMRERAAAVGGELRTGAAVGGGFLVEATLPAGSGDDR